MSQEKDVKKLFLGNLDRSVEDKDIEERFSKYGKIVDIKLKKTGVNCFGFLEFENHQDAEDAIKEDNRELKGKQLRVELGNGGRKKRTEGCFTCGSLDHIARDCDKNPRRFNNNRRSRSRSGDRRRRSSRSNERDRKRDNFSERRRYSPKEDRYASRRDAPSDRRRRSSRSDSRDKNRRPYENKRRSPDQYDSSNNGFRNEKYDRKPRDSSPAGYQSKYSRGGDAEGGRFSNGQSGSGFSNGGSNNYGNSGSDSRYTSSRQDTNYRNNNSSNNTGKSYSQQPRSNSR